jgi:hypothetical protein
LVFSNRNQNRDPGFPVFQFQFPSFFLTPLDVVKQTAFKVFLFFIFYFFNEKTHVIPSAPREERKISRPTALLSLLRTPTTLLWLPATPTPTHCTRSEPLSTIRYFSPHAPLSLSVTPAKQHGSHFPSLSISDFLPPATPALRFALFDFEQWVRILGL